MDDIELSVRLLAVESQLKNLSEIGSSLIGLYPVISDLCEDMSDVIEDINKLNCMIVGKNVDIHNLKQELKMANTICR